MIPIGFSGQRQPFLSEKEKEAEVMKVPRQGKLQSTGAERGLLNHDSVKRNARLPGKPKIGELLVYMIIQANRKINPPPPPRNVENPPRFM